MGNYFFIISAEANVSLVLTTTSRSSWIIILQFKCKQKLGQNARMSLCNKEGP